MKIFSGSLTVFIQYRQVYTFALGGGRYCQDVENRQGTKEINLLDELVGLGLGALIAMVLLVVLEAVVVSEVVPDSVGLVSFLDRFEWTYHKMCARREQA